MDDKYIEIANILAKIEAIKIEVEGMKAANMERIHDGLALAYNENMFNDAAREVSVLAGELLTFKG